MKTSIRIGLVFSLLAVSACASTWPYANDAAKVKAVRQVREPVIPVMAHPRPEAGSLWSESSGISLYSDPRADQVGDLITVRIVEDPEARLNANTNTSRSSGVDAAQLKFLGYMKALADANPRLAQNPGKDNLFSASLGLNFDGQGSSDRNGHVKAYITAMVVHILPNGYLVINGKREIRVNNETQFITISGVVRPEDISPTNEISSAYVANAKIIYSGIGPVADKQKPGWLGRVVDHAWPF